MGRRLDLHTILQGFVGVRSDGKPNVYFQPPSNVKMNYPCIVYKLDDVDAIRANNRLYRLQLKYMVTVIDPDPDSEIPGKILEMPLCAFDRAYTASDMHHNVYNLYF